MQLKDLGDDENNTYREYKAGSYRIMHESTPIVAAAPGSKSSNVQVLAADEIPNLDIDIDLKGTTRF